MIRLIQNTGARDSLERAGTYEGVKMDNAKINKYASLIKISALVVFGIAILFAIVKKPEISPVLGEYYRQVDFTVYGGPAAESAWALSKVSTGFVASADTASFGQGLSDFYLMKFDENLSLKWTRTFGTKSKESLISTVETKDGEYLMAGGTDTGYYGESDGFVVMADSDGMEKWRSYFGGPNHDYLYSVCQAGKGAYIAAGYSSSFNVERNSDGYIVKFDDKGEMIWEKTYGKEGWDIFYKITPLKNGDFAAAGYTTSAGKGRSSMYIVRIDAQGNTKWSHAIGDVRDDRAISIIQSLDGGLLIAANSSSYVARGFGWDIVLIKTDENLNPQWSKVFPACEVEPGSNILENSDGTIMIAGVKKCYGPCDHNAYVIKTDSAGEMIWQRIYAGPGTDKANAIAKTGRGYAVFGTTMSKGANGDVFMVEIDENGEIINN